MQTRNVAVVLVVVAVCAALDASKLKSLIEARAHPSEPVMIDGKELFTTMTVTAGQNVYHNATELRDNLFEMRQSCRGAMQILQTGTASTNNFPILVPVFSKDATTRPLILLVATLRGDEVYGKELILALMNNLCQGVNTSSGVYYDLLASYDFVFVPMANPDAINATGDGGSPFNPTGKDIASSFSDGISALPYTPPNENLALEDVVYSFNFNLIIEIRSGTQTPGELAVTYPWNIARQPAMLDTNAFKVPANMLASALSSTLTPFAGQGPATVVGPVSRSFGDYCYFFEGAYALTAYLSDVKTPDESTLTTLFASHLSALLATFPASALGAAATVTWTDGTPVPYPSFYVTGLNDAGGLTAPTGSGDGKFWRLLGAGTYTLNVVADGAVALVSATVNVAQGGSTPVSIVLTKGTPPSLMFNGPTSNPLSEGGKAGIAIAVIAIVVGVVAAVVIYRLWRQHRYRDINLHKDDLTTEVEADKDAHTDVAYREAPAAPANVAPAPPPPSEPPKEMDSVA